MSSFVTWGPINESIAGPTQPDEAFWPEDAASSAEGDVAVTSAVVAHLTSQTPTVVFVQLDEVDHQGHVAGFSPSVPEYTRAIEVVDSQIGEMLDAVRARPGFDAEDWLFLVTTDHGGKDRWHGMHSEEERTIFIIAAGSSIRRHRTISPGPGHTAIPPTVLAHLGLPIDEAWGWESEPFGL